MKSINKKTALVFALSSVLALGGLSSIANAQAPAQPAPAQTSAQAPMQDASANKQDNKVVKKHHKSKSHKKAKAQETK